MLEGYRDGTFQNGIGNGGDWKEWNGAPSGYEGMLTDAYFPLALLDHRPAWPGSPYPLTEKEKNMLRFAVRCWRLPAILIVALVWGGGFALAQAASADATAFPSDPPTIHASPISGPIVLDGKLSEEAWKNCVEVSDFATTAGGLPANAVSMRVGYTPETLYLAIECSGRTAKPLASLREHDANLCAEDSIELYLAPTFGKTDYFLFMANAIGTRYESHGMDASWNGPWQVAASSAGGNWRLEIAIPFSSLGINPPPA